MGDLSKYVFWRCDLCGGLALGELPEPKCRFCSEPMPPQMNPTGPAKTPMNTGKMETVGIEPTI